MDYNHGFGGALLSPIDNRDYKIKNYLAKGYRPKEVRPNLFLPVENQGNIGCCVAEALAAMKSYQEYKERKTIIQFSTDFIYHNRSANDFQGKGMYTREALSQLVKYGVPEKKYLPTKTEYPDFTTKNIVKALYDLAKPQVIFSYLSGDNDDDICEAIYQTGAAILTVGLVQSFSANYKTFGGSLYLNQPENNETPNGYHAVCAIGYNEKGILIQNSYGTEWGQEGFAVIPYGYTALRERWTVVDKIDKWDIIELYVDDKRYRRNGVEGELDIPPKIINGRTLVPLRFISESLGAEVEWIESQRKIVIRKKQ